MRPDQDQSARDADPELNAMLRALDHAAPRVSASELAARARSRRPNHWLRRAAIVTLALGGAGAAWALPGSPLREWWQARGADRGSEGVVVEPATPPALPVASDAPTGGVVFDATRPQVVVFAAAPRAVVDVVVVDDGAFALESFGGAARFGAGPDALRVEQIDAGTRFRLNVPRAAAALELRVGADVVYRWPDAPTTDSLYTIPLDR